ncbi:MAG: hypothetical protein D6698_13980 [Gammaproteobacteria bacterium]|nr:MAG: hypothetical protein D6698_13980 [Gammaproteobacteria bacterium]
MLDLLFVANNHAQHGEQQYAYQDDSKCFHYVKVVDSLFNFPEIALCSENQFVEMETSELNIIELNELIKVQKAQLRALKKINSHLLFYTIILAISTGIAVLFTAYTLSLQ